MRTSYVETILQNILMLTLIIGIGSIFLLFVGIDALEGRNSFQFFADSNTYYSGTMDFIRGENLNLLISINNNYAGPAIVLLAGLFNYFCVLIINSIIFVLTVSSISKRYNINYFIFTSLLLINPITISSLLSVNKEILSLLFVYFLLIYIDEKTVRSFLFAFVLALLVRWQLALFFIIIVPMLHARRDLSHRVMLTTILLLSISASYVLLVDIISPLNDRFLLSIESSPHQGSGLFESLVLLQMDGYYFLTFAPKIASIMFSLGLRFDLLLNQQNTYNHFFQLLHSTCLMILIVVLFFKGRMSIIRQLPYSIIVYCLVFGISPIFAPRYFYPVYVIGLLVLLMDKETANRLGARQNCTSTDSQTAGHSPA